MKQNKGCTGIIFFISQGLLGRINKYILKIIIVQHKKENILVWFLIFKKVTAEKNNLCMMFILSIYTLQDQQKHLN